jgi:hypothetical protein
MQLVWECSFQIQVIKVTAILITEMIGDITGLMRRYAVADEERDLIVTNATVEKLIKYTVQRYSDTPLNLNALTISRLIKHELGISVPPYRIRIASAGGGKFIDVDKEDVRLIIKNSGITY